MADFLEEVRDHSRRSSASRPHALYLYSINGRARVYPEQLYTCARICEKLVELLEKIVLQSKPECSENKEDATLSLMIAPLATTATECSENKKDTTLSLMIAPFATTATSPPSLCRRRRRRLLPRHPYLQNHPHRQSRRRALRHAGP